jgi:hypothetical protein
LSFLNGHLTNIQLNLFCFAKILVRLATASIALASFFAAVAESYPPTDSPLPMLIEPGQTEEPAVYRARRAALMKEMDEGVAVIYAEGRKDGDGFRQSSDFFYLAGVQEEGAILVLAPKERPGIYLPDEKLGVRIEDDVLVTEAGAKFLSDGLPRQIEEIERWLAARPTGANQH